MHLHNYSKIILAATCLSLLLSLSSCFKIEMRESSVNSEESAVADDDDSAQTLTKASKKNSVESSADESVEEVTEVNSKEVLNISICGNITIDENIISDAAARAGEGQSYSFLRMFTGIYNNIGSSDLAFCSYSENNEAQLPIEAVGAICDLGIDAINTKSSSLTDESLNRYSVTAIKEGSENVVINKNGLKIACLSVSGVDYTENKYQSEIEYSDFVSDIVIVFVDWDNDNPTDGKDKIMYNIAEAGADIIIGNGDALGKLEWIDTGDGTLTLAAYSLGNILTDSDNTDDLCGGVLTLSVAYGGGSIELDNVTLIPTVVHYTSGESSKLSGYQVFTLNEYSDELAQNHAVPNVSVEKMKDKAENLIDEDFLPDYLR